MLPIRVSIRSNHFSETTYHARWEEDSRFDVVAEMSIQSQYWSCANWNRDLTYRRMLHGT